MYVNPISDDVELQANIDCAAELVYKEHSDDCDETPSLPEVTEDGWESYSIQGSDPEPIRRAQPPHLLINEQQCDFHLHTTDKQPLHEQLPSGMVLGKKYRIIDWLGRGSFGCTYLAMCSDGQEVAVKARVSSTSGNNFSGFLQDEVDIYCCLGATGHADASSRIPRIYCAGIETLNASDGQQAHVSYLVMQRLQQNILSYCKQNWQHDGTLSHTTAHTKHSQRQHWVRTNAKNMLKAIIHLHSQGYLHRDIKTENLCLADDGNIYIIDMGFAAPAFGRYRYKGYYSSRTATFCGTPDYSSLDALCSMPQTVKDDIESLVYCLLELEMPDCTLPWYKRLIAHKLPTDEWTFDCLEDSGADKQAMWVEACKKGDIPQYLVNIYDYICKLAPWQVPDYHWLLMALDSGLTGQPPCREPAILEYRAWPDRPCHYYDHNVVTAALLQQLRDAASTALQDSWPAAATATEAQLAISRSWQDITSATAEALISPDPAFAAEWLLRKRAAEPEHSRDHYGYSNEQRHVRAKTATAGCSNHPSDGTCDSEKANELYELLCQCRDSGAAPDEALLPACRAERQLSANQGAQLGLSHLACGQHIVQFPADECSCDLLASALWSQPDSIPTDGSQPEE